ncbi:MAG: hypothetical protein GY789_22565 [Hyphomicrobiales bacterium]|nr:hypothetical protein [Hyphomicrobiales bacterium]MCP4997424.1 hypothetical protein [Hyphomicrobiales bacterium]
MKRSSLWKAFASIAAAALFGLAACAPASAINIVNGDCNIIIQNVQVGEGTLEIPEAGCNRTRPEDSFRVRYFWLDSLSLSFLMAGYADENLRQIAGSSPQMWRGGIYPVLSEILDRFGERPGPNSKLLYPGYTARLLTRGGTGEDHNFRYFKDIPETVRRNLQIYNGYHPILWPDIDGVREFWETDGWPSGYAMSYGTQPEHDSYNIAEIESRNPQAGGTIGYCTFLYGFVSRNNYDSYMRDMREFGDLVANNRIGPVMEPYSVGDAGFNSAGSFISYDAMRYFGGQNWPGDFLVKFGRYSSDDCAQTSGMGFSVLPRELFVLVAVVEATAERLKLNGFGYNVDADTRLRADIAPADYQLETFSFPALNRGDTVVVPLRIELRYDLGRVPFAYMRPNSASERYFFAIGGFGQPAVLNDGSVSPPYVEKPLRSFRPPSFTDVERTYYFGEARDLKQVVIGENAYEVRETPRMAMLSVAGYDGASCPFLEFTEADGKSSLHGRVLVGASDASKAETETVPVPRGATTLIISEREPEISYLSEIALVERTTGARTVLAGNLVLKPFDRLELEVPKLLRDKTLDVQISGYYEPLRPPDLAQR